MGLEVEKLKNRYVTGLVNHLVNTTAIQSVSSPLMATIETTVAGMSDDNSLNARLLGVGLGYLGLGFIYAKGLKSSRKLFGINDETLERIKGFHDAVFSSVYCATLQPGFYLIAGSRDFSEIAIGTAGAIGVGFIFGGPVGYSIDLFGDFSGIRENKRVPNSLESLAQTIDKSQILTSTTNYISGKVRGLKNKIESLGRNTKKSILVGLVASSIGLTTGVYALTSDEELLNSQINNMEINQSESNK